MNRLSVVAGAVLACSVAFVASSQAAGPPMVTLEDGAKTQQGAKDDNGLWVLPDGTPTYHIKKDNTLDWFTYSGFRRYHSECHVCHGPEGEGSTYAPALVQSLKTLSYEDFVAVVASGRVRNEAGTEFVMPALGDNKNVMCYIDDIYVYLKARADGALPRGRPPGRDDKPQRATDHDKDCFGQ